MSWLRFGRLGSILARNAFRSLEQLAESSTPTVKGCGDRTERLLSLAGSIFASTEVSC